MRNCAYEAEKTSTVVVTKVKDAVSNRKMPLDAIADTRTFVHARDAILGGSKSLIIKANDIDVTMW